MGLGLGDRGIEDLVGRAVGAVALTRRGDVLCIVMRAASERRGDTFKRLPESQGHNLVLSVLNVPGSMGYGV